MWEFIGTPLPFSADPEALEMDIPSQQAIAGPPSGPQKTLQAPGLQHWIAPPKVKGKLNDRLIDWFDWFVLIDLIDLFIGLVD